MALLDQIKFSMNVKIKIEKVKYFVIKLKPPYKKKGRSINLSQFYIRNYVDLIFVKVQ